MIPRRLRTRLIAALSSTPLWRLWLQMIGGSVVFSEGVVASLNLAMYGQFPDSFAVVVTLIVSVLAASLFGGMMLLFAGELQRLNRQHHAAEVALQDSLQFARQLLEVIPSPVFYKDRDGRYLGCNGAFERYLGRRREEIVGRSVYDLAPKDLADAYHGADMALFEHPGIQIYEAAVHCADERVHDVIFHKATFARADGSIGGLVGVILDITERKRNEEIVRQSEHRFAVAFRASPVAASIARAADGYAIDVNDKYERDFGWPRDEIVGHTSVDVGLWPNAAERQRWFETLQRNGTLLDYETTWRTRQGQERQVSLSAELIDLEGERCVLAYVQDITERKRAEAQLRLAGSVFANTHEGIAITDAYANIVEVNPAFCDITGYSREEVLGRNPRMLKSNRQGPEFFAAMWEAIRSRGFWRGEIWNRRKDGEIFPELLTISAVRNAAGSITHYLGTFTDISLLKQQERRLERMAHYDALTGIPNRVLLADRIQQAIAQTQRTGGLMAVGYLDLDGFKPINDRLGHEAGDRVLVEMARRLKECVRGGDTVARLGGDEFVLLLLGLDESREYEAVLGRVLESMSQPVFVAGQSLCLSASIGVTVFPVDDADADALLRHADQAMYSAKQSGRCRYHLFDPEHDRRTRAHREATERIGEAIAGGELVLHYQPIVNMRLGCVVGAEALVRWHHPEQGLVPPGEFLPVIEDTDLIVDLGRWVIGRALAQMAAWREQGLQLAVSVNIAARHLQRDDFADELRAALAAQPTVPAASLDLEVLETAALEDMGRVSKVLEACRALGVTFALDDFGTGYSSLTYFKALPAHTLKIDQSFVRDMLRDADDLAIVKGVIGLAAAFRRQVIAEGVENVEQGLALLGLGCELAQGYGIGRPMPAENIPDWVRNWRPDPTWLGTMKGLTEIL
jgi:diguanylate cyclase (GGDEF)-like protein/PAS domain S-box-containing protein